MSIKNKEENYKEREDGREGRRKKGTLENRFLLCHHLEKLTRIAFCAVPIFKSLHAKFPRWEKVTFLKIVTGHCCKIV